MKLLNVTAGSILGVYRFFFSCCCIFRSPIKHNNQLSAKDISSSCMAALCFSFERFQFFTDIFVKGSCQQACAFSFVLLVFCHFKKFLQRIYLINIL